MPAKGPSDHQNWHSNISWFTSHGRKVALHIRSISSREEWASFKLRNYVPEDL
jgi:hypothetical protein